MKRTGIYITMLWMGCCSINAQTLTLTNAIKIAQENSLDAQIARFSFMSKYWQYRSFKAELLPSVNLSGMLGNFNHSVVEARDPETGRVNQVNNNTMTNYLTLSLDQKIAATGGTVSLQSYLYRLDQFDYKEKTYNSQPLRISYTQSLRSFNALMISGHTAKSISAIHIEVKSVRPNRSSSASILTERLPARSISWSKLYLLIFG